MLQLYPAIFKYGTAKAVPTVVVVLHLALI